MDAFEAGLSDLDFLAKSCPYDPDTIKPGDFDFTPHLSRDKADAKKKKSKKEDKDSDKEDHKEDPQDHKPKLPRRLKLSAFSTSVGQGQAAWKLHRSRCS